MATIQNKIIAKSIQEEYANKTALLNLGVLSKNTDLTGKGKGDTIQMTQFETLSEGVQELQIGDFINYERLAQKSFEVSVGHFAKGFTIFDQEIQNSVSGESFEQAGTRMLSEALARALDTKVMDELMTGTRAVVDATGGLTPQVLLSNLYKAFGEGALDKAGAIVVSPMVVSQLLVADGNSNIKQASVDGYTATFPNEVGKLFNKVPIITSERVPYDADGDVYKALAVQKDSIIYAVAKDINVETSRVSANRSTNIDADTMFAVKLTKEPVVFNTKSL